MPCQNRASYVKIINRFEQNPSGFGATDKLWGKLQELQKEERAKGGVLDMETHVVSGLTAYGAGYIDEELKDLEAVVGLQTDKPLKRAFMPYGGIKMAQQACETYGYTPDPELGKIFTGTLRHASALFPAGLSHAPALRHLRLELLQRHGSQSG